MGGNEDLRLFVYGSLREAEVQRAVFGRVIGGEPDALPGYRLGTIDIRDVDGDGGITRYQNIFPSGESGDEVPGLVLTLTVADFDAADDYETPTAYRRIVVRLKAGGQAYAYIGRGDPSA
jgi:gamma-glutamylcyclotransferase (GGCT)/AIG2-like uncharacterized protein YtfP